MQRPQDVAPPPSPLEPSHLNENPMKGSRSGIGCNVEMTVLGMTVRCATLPMDALPSVFYSLMRLMFFTDTADERFFQCSVTD